MLLLAFAMLTFKKVEMESYTYQAINLLAASLLLVYAWMLNSYPFIALNAVWAAVALYGLTRLSLRAKS